MRCSGPWWRLLKRSMGRSCDVNEHDPFPEDGDVSWRMDPSRLSVVKAVTRRMVPYLVEATLIPTALFYVFFITFGLRWAIVAAVGWTYAAVARRIVSGRPIPGLLMLAAVGISVRTVVSVQQQQLRLFRSADSSYGRHRCLLRLVGRGRPAAHRPVCRRLLPAQLRSRRPAGGGACLSAHLPVGGGQRSRGRDEPDAALDGAGRGDCRNGDGRGLGDHLHWRGAHGVGQRFERPAAKGSPLRLPPTGDCMPTSCRLPEIDGRRQRRGHHRSRQTMPKAAPARRSPPIGPS